MLYGVNGEDSFGIFDVERRYSDFEALRKALVLHWPGCIIPQIPEKTLVGNLDPDFIDTRKKLLDYFLKQIASMDYLY